MNVGKWIMTTIVVAGSMAAMAEEDGSTLVAPQAAEAGVERCLTQWELIGRFVEQGTSQVGAHIVYHSTEPDDRMARMAVEEAFPSRSVLALISVSPNSAGSCDATLSRITWTEQSCLEVAMEQGAGAFEGALSRNIVRLSGNMSRYLMPAGEGCVMVNFEQTFGQ